MAGSCLPCPGWAIERSECVLRGEASLGEAVTNIKRDTRDFVRRQYAWFRLQDERIRWFENVQVGEIERLA